MQSVAMAHAALPSPTLTNPDMILPYGEYSRSSSPSPPPSGMRPSPSGLPRERHAAPTLTFAPMPDDSHSAQSDAQHDVTLGDTSPTGTFGHGQPLWDIQEVGTATQRNKLQHISGRAPRRQSPPLASSPTLENAPVKHKQQRKLRVIDGDRDASEPSGLSPQPYSRTMDDMSDDDEEKKAAAREGPAEDEEDNADPAEESFSVSERLAKDLRRMSNGTILEEDEDEEPVVLSKRAESILANAKMRLNTMEGNLSLARTSLLVSPTPSGASSLSNSPYSPKHTPNSSTDLNGHRVPLGVGVPASKHRMLHYSPFGAASSPNHARVFSETSVPSSLYTSLVAKGASGTRSASALGTARGLDASQDPKLKDRLVRRSQSNKHSRENSSQAQSAHTGPRNYLLSGNSNVVASTPQAADPHTPSKDIGSAPGLGLKTSPSHESLSSPLTADSSQFAPNAAGLSRSRSTVQMRDVRDQVKDLKGRISSLKQRTKEDSLRRRSLQSLRTPSPFTAAEQWYTGANGYRESSLSANAGTGKVERWAETGNPFEAEKGGPSQDQAEVEVEDEGSIQDRSEHRSDEPVDVAVEDEGEDVVQEEGLESEEDQRVSNDDPEEFADEYDPTAEGPREGPEEDEVREAVEEQDSFSAPAGERHEDRADAFDYEHFYLHSGMGQYSQRDRGRRDSDVSVDSSGSAESSSTARGAEQPDVSAPPRSLELPEDEEEEDEDEEFPTQHSAQPPPHQRQNSTDSVSTVATFATAAEDRSVESSPIDVGFGDVDWRSTPLPTTPQPWLSKDGGARGESADQAEGWLGGAHKANSNGNGNSNGNSHNVARRPTTNGASSSTSSPNRPTSAIRITESSPKNDTQVSHSHHHTQSYQTIPHPQPPRAKSSASPSPKGSISHPTPYGPPLSHATSFTSDSSTTTISNSSSCSGTPTPPAAAASSSAPTVQLSLQDRQLLEQVLDSLRRVSLRLHEVASIGKEGTQRIEGVLDGGPVGGHGGDVDVDAGGHRRNNSEDKRTPAGAEMGMLRRRLDDARRILDGERHGEVL